MIHAGEIGSQCSMNHVEYMPEDIVIFRSNNSYSILSSQTSNESTKLVSASKGQLD